MESNFEAVISKHQDSVFRMLCHLTKDRSLSQDLLQETLLRAYHCEKPIDESKYRNWLLKVAKNIAIDYNRRKSRLRKLESDIDEINFSLSLDSHYYCSDNSNYDLSQTEETRRYEYVSNLVKKKFECCFLLKSEKTILKYCCLKGFSYAKSAKILNCSPVTVRRNYLSAISKIREYF
jgi:RNA polymerase sigma factor (sigma-70 family)